MIKFVTGQLNWNKILIFGFVFVSICYEVLVSTIELDVGYLVPNAP